MHLYDHMGLGAEAGADLRAPSSTSSRLAQAPHHLSATRKAHQDRRGVGGMAGAPFQTSESILNSEKGLGWSDRASQGLRRHFGKMATSFFKAFQAEVQKIWKNLIFFGIVDFTQFIYI